MRNISLVCASAVTGSVTSKPASGRPGVHRCDVDILGAKSRSAKRVILEAAMENTNLTAVLD